ncbi:hypothetical protein SCATT_p17340 (plasmid) [Streptantibioticus cattleyicolor NRRL 8057 = DSM 46488]|uniref:Uncharacterized protein n=1 Tax=Streptantibioticus cattleyicolor (strain ATCC 35852 / DSM 46488 / JCM 4925 / NBRC 14057 / NRRL 8057) TaxID=1003195 RepID=G8XDK1_STREN|nr:hypothetical protein SCATT_p00020 [Streptantibioticus cattleyicolor NRRL 8057 = DSM 46488]AEW99927.1 hypothetical protein SCATT_p17340 [Streptantibioticus cattleyicolor NRRL 8057 = DSM 46488]CCB71041.1 protein of unknown function [Streptantibioticus cattleyicolor NRRL 8057 = DSM 46488]
MRPPDRSGNFLRTVELDDAARAALGLGVPDPVSTVFSPDAVSLAPQRVLAGHTPRKIARRLCRNAPADRALAASGPCSRPSSDFMGSPWTGARKRPVHRAPPGLSSFFPTAT